MKLQNAHSFEWFGTTKRNRNAVCALYLRLSPFFEINFLSFINFKSLLTIGVCPSVDSAIF